MAIPYKYRERTRGEYLLEKIAAILVGSLLLGIGVNFFLAPYRLMDGGLVGLGLLIHYHFGFPVGLSMICISIPLYIYAWNYGKSLFFHSLHGLLISSFCIDLFSEFKVYWELPIYISAIIGGILIGLGVGLMLRYETSTGGTDMLAQILAERTAINVGVLIFIIDGCIIISGLKIVGLNIFLYSCLTILTVGIFTSITVMKNGNV
ncbi:YitT family protein [Peribacillus sp. SCS-155]|uniref:YitT family protein n=1 Tax=Peribacillus sedimenti TaxID=3115297 RepID=UPI0039067E85